MTALFVWIGVSAITTLGIVSALALGARRHIPTLTTETGPESMILLNGGHAGSSGESRFAHSFAP